ncbi:ankyrin repeat domain-containing protein, partial [bacterium]|nr:ankyrin repeat domain-containing protein [bacterium]
TGGDTLIQSLQAALNRDTKDAQEDALMILFSSLNQARTAYEGSASQYIAAAHPLSKEQARDWSCMPGVEERLLDGLTPKRLSQEPAENPEGIPLEEQYVQWLAHSFISKTAEGLLPSPVLYSMVLQALPEGLRCRIEAQERYHFSIEAGVDKEAVIQQYVQQYQGQQRDRLTAIAKALLGKDEVSLVELQQAVFFNKDDETQKLSLHYEAVLEFFPHSNAELIKHHLKHWLLELGFASEIAGTLEEQYALLQKSIDTILKQQARHRIERILKTSYQTPKEAYDDLKCTSSGLRLLSQPKDALVIRDQSGIQQNITALLDIDKEEMKANILAQTGMGADWLELLNHVLIREQRDGIDSCLSLAAAGFAGILHKEGNIDTTEVARALRQSKDRLLALGSAYQLFHPDHYFHYYVSDGALKTALKEQLLVKISQELGNDYYERTPFFCQQELVTEIVGEWIANNELPQRNREMKALVTWLVFQRNTASIILLQSNSMLSSLLKESPAFAGKLFVGIAKQGSLELIQILLEAGAAVDLKDSYGHTALTRAAREGHLAVVQVLLEAGATVDLQDNTRMTALMYAAQERHLAVVQALLEARAAVDLQDFLGKTALMFAAHRGHVEVVQALLEAGAIVDLKDDYGDTAFACAAWRGRADVIQVLLNADAHLNFIKSFILRVVYLKHFSFQFKSNLNNKNIFNALTHALKRKDDQCACILINRFVAIDFNDSHIDFRSLLFMVAQQAQPSTLDLLMYRSAQWRFPGVIQRDNI